MSETTGSPPQSATGPEQPVAGVAGVLPSPVSAQAGSSPMQLSPERTANVARLAARRFPDPSKVNANWWVLAILLLALAFVSSLLAAEVTAFSYIHRLAAAAAALLDVIALTTFAHVILLWYQSKITEPDPSAADPAQETVNFRQRGLKAAVIGQDGRASTSKTQVVLWTAAVVWALIDLLLLARAYPSRNLFTATITSNWRPEYLVLLGLPVAAAATAKTVVSGSNNGRGPVPGDGGTEVPGRTTRVYKRHPVRPGVKGFIKGMAELITADDGTVAWPDLQYVAFTLITLVYFVTQLLAQPQQGLPPVPAALLTLMGVSVSGYTASKIVETKGQWPDDGQTQVTEG